MELHQLRYFVQVARLESVSRAAQVLHVSQPALSKTIAKLEDELGCKLFDRAGKRLHLNDRGRYFLKEAEAALDNLKAAVAVVGAPNSRLGGSVSVGVFGPQGEAVQCLQLFMKANPDVNVSFDARQRSATTHVTREFDLVFYPDGPSFAGISGIPYARNRMRLAMPADHPLAISSKVDLIQFRDDPFIFMNTTAGIYEQMYQLCLSNGFSPRVRAVVSSGMAQMRMVEAGLGVALVDAPGAKAHATSVPEGAVEASLRRAGVEAGKVVYAELRGNTPEQVLCLASRPPALLSLAGRELLDHALRYFGIPDDDAIVGCFEGN